MRRQWRPAGSKADFEAERGDRTHRHRTSVEGAAALFRDGRPMTADAVVDLQRTAGNAATAARIADAPPVQRAGAESAAGKGEKAVDAISRLRRAHERALKRIGDGAEPLPPGEYKTPFGSYTAKAGRGDQPWILSNKQQHPGSETIGEKYVTDTGEEYKGLVPQLDAEHFEIVTRAMRDGSVQQEDLAKLDATQRRAATMLFAVSQIEEGRFPGAGKPQRSALDRQSDPAHEAPEFLKDFPMGLPGKSGGGAHYYERVLSGKQQLSDEARKTLEEMSDSSEG